jgi:hypothetical protein
MGMVMIMMGIDQDDTSSFSTNNVLSLLNPTVGIHLLISKQKKSKDKPEK